MEFSIIDFIFFNPSLTYPPNINVIISYVYEIRFWNNYLPTFLHDVMKYPVFLDGFPKVKTQVILENMHCEHVILLKANYRRCYAMSWSLPMTPLCALHLKQLSYLLTVIEWTPSSLTIWAGTNIHNRFLVNIMIVVIFQLHLIS